MVNIKEEELKVLTDEAELKKEKSSIVILCLFSNSEGETTLYADPDYIKSLGPIILDLKKDTLINKEGLVLFLPSPSTKKRA